MMPYRTTDRLMEIRAEGIQAHGEGKNAGDCPYGTNLEEMAWTRGWLAAEMASQAEKKERLMRQRRSIPKGHSKRKGGKRKGGKRRRGKR